MAAITQFAQPGVAFMQAYEASRDNRLARSQAEAEAAAERARQQMRQQAFQSIVGTGDNQVAPDVVAAQLAGAGLLEDARLVQSMSQRQQARQRQIQEEESAIFTNARVEGPEGIDAIRRRLEMAGSELASASPEELQRIQQAYAQTTSQPGWSIQRITDPDTGQATLARVNSRSGETIPLGVRPAPNGVAQAISAGLSQVAAAQREGIAAEGTGARDRAVQAASQARSAASTTLATAREINQAPEGAFGFRGNITRDTASIVEQVLGQNAANQVARLGSGAQMDELARIQVAAQIQVSQSVARITGEESGRITETERALTQQVVGIAENLSTKSRAQEAMAFLYPLDLAEVNRNMLLARGQLEYDFVDSRGEPNMASIERHVTAPMVEAGFTEEQIARAIRDAVTITRQQTYMLSRGAFANE